MGKRKRSFSRNPLWKTLNRRTIVMLRSLRCFITHSGTIWEVKKSLELWWCWNKIPALLQAAFTAFPSDRLRACGFCRSSSRSGENDISRHIFHSLCQSRQNGSRGAGGHPPREFQGLAWGEKPTLVDGRPSLLPKKYQKIALPWNNWSFPWLQSLSIQTICVVMVPHGGIRTVGAFTKTKSKPFYLWCVPKAWFSSKNYFDCHRKKGEIEIKVKRSDSSVPAAWPVELI